MTLQSGTRLGRYEIVAPLGAGGMGEVYRARDSRLGRDVALKVLPAALAADGERLARFEREARTVAALSHPGIVTLHSVEDDGATRFLTMELVEGRGLDTLVAAGGLPVESVRELGIAVAEALAAAHERGIVHRDLKPANVMRTDDGRVKVLDFGLATLSAPKGASDLSEAATAEEPFSRAGDVVGTVPYMAPEQLRGEEVDARADVFSLGVLLYELACGRRPFRGATAAVVTSAILRDPPPSFSSVRGDVPPELERVVLRCLEKEREARYPGARAVAEALREAGPGGASASRVSGRADGPRLSVPPPAPPTP